MLWACSISELKVRWTGIVSSKIATLLKAYDILQIGSESQTSMTNNKPDIGLVNKQTVLQCVRVKFISFSQIIFMVANKYFVQCLTVPKPLEVFKPTIKHFHKSFNAIIQQEAWYKCKAAEEEQLSS